jgi:cysteine synthase A
MSGSLFPPCPETRRALDRAWICETVRAIDADFARSADTHLIRLDLPQFRNVRLYLKDESTHPTGSLKHRLARSLMLYGICNGWVREGAPVIEASSGSTAISEAYFARLLGLPFIAVVPRSTAAKKIAAIEFYGGRCHFADDPARLNEEAEALARETGGHFLDQFTYAERATDWRGNNNIAESLFAQMALEPDPAPDWVVVGAGTGGTSATLGRYVRYKPCYADRTKICVVDPEGSAFFPFYRDGAAPTTARASAVVEGVGRPRVEASFMPGVIDRMIAAPDAACVAAARWLEGVLGRKCGPSTGLNMLGALTLAEELADAGRSGSIATLICDPGERYLDTCFNDGWVAAQGLDLAPWTDIFARFEATGRFEAQLDSATR